MPNLLDKKIITTLTNEQVKLFQSLGLIIENEYFHLPQYFRNLGAGEFEIINFDDLPKDIKQTIQALEYVKKQREEMKQNNRLMPEIRVH